MSNSMETIYKVGGGLMIGVGLLVTLFVPMIGLPVAVIGVLCGIAANSRKKDRLHAETLAALKDR